MAQNGTDWTFAIDEATIRETISKMQSKQSWAKEFPDVQARNEQNTTGSVVTGVLNDIGRKARNTVWKENIDSLYDRITLS